MFWRFLAGPPIDRVVQQTPDDRDRFIDAIRAFAIVIVVLGHGFLALVAWHDQVPRAGNLLSEYPTGQLITWLFQVMPLFFFAGGYSNTASWEHRGGATYAQWMWRRAQRLLRPLWGYLFVMVPIALVLGVSTKAAISTPILVIATQLLWFLGIYLIVTALTPVLVFVEVRHAWAFIVAGLASIAIIDAARLHQWGGALPLLNFVLVWSLLASLGSRFRHGLLSGQTAVAMSSVALAVNVLIVLVLQWYPRSMVGMPGDRISNVAPPTLALTMHGLMVIGLAVAFAEPMRRLMTKTQVWRTTVHINLVMMTIYLWHLPVLMTLFLIERTIGFDRPTRITSTIGPVPDKGFWLASIPHWFAFVALVMAVVRLMWPLEYLRISWWDREIRHSPRGATVLSAIGAVLTGLALLMLSAGGLTLVPLRTTSYLGLPLNAVIALILLVLGAALLKRAGAQPTR